ncbi:MAG: Ig-like domain-containing protein [Methanobacteriota archaeon]
MSRKARAKGDGKKELLAKGYVECFYCNKPVKPSALRCPSCGKIFSSGKKLAAIIVAALVMASATAYVYLDDAGHEPGTPDVVFPSVQSNSPIGSAVATSSAITVTFTRDMVASAVQSAFSTSPSTSGAFSWSGRTMTYVPYQALAQGSTYRVTVGSGARCVCGNPLDCGIYAWSFTTVGGTATDVRRDVGTGDDDFWTAYPSSHLHAGTTVNHPQWVRTAVASKPIFILTHSEGCAPCITMTDIYNNVKAKYGSQLAFYDLISGTSEPQANETFAAYDPNDSQHYVPLPIVLSKGPGGEIIWHSWEGVVYQPELEGWLNDALSYHAESGLVG